MTAEILNMVIDRRLSDKAGRFEEETRPEPATGQIGRLLEGLRYSAEGLQKASSLLAQTLDVLQTQLTRLEPRVEFWLARSTDSALTRERSGTSIQSSRGIALESPEMSNAVYLGFTKIQEHWRLAIRVEAERLNSDTGELLEQSLVSESILKDTSLSIQIAAIQKMPEFLESYRVRIDELAAMIEQTAEAVQVSADSGSGPLQHSDESAFSSVQNGGPDNHI